MRRGAIIGLCMLLGSFSNLYAQVIKKPIPDKLVVLTFDDAVVTQYTVVAPLLKKYGFGATFFVCEFPGNPNFTDKTKYLSWEQIADLNKMGFEIANHTWHHSKVNKMDKAKFSAELEYVEQKCAELGIPKPVSFAYPAYDTARRNLEVLKDHGYKYARAGFNRAYDPLTDHPYLMPGFTMLDTNKVAINKAFQLAKDQKVVLITIHGVPDVAHAWVNTSPEVFEEHLKYLKQNHYKVIALRDLDKYIDAGAALKQHTSK